MVGGREFHRVGLEFLNALVVREVLLEFRDNEYFFNEKKVILYVVELDQW